MLKKFLIDNFAKSRNAKYVRNFFGIFPSYFNIDYTLQNISVSDTFFWRTDNNFKTYFSYTDLLKLFYSIKNSNIEIIFFDKNFKFIKKINISSLTTINKLIIDKDFFDGIEDYGTFYVFHNSLEKFNSIIRNSCYTGFSYKNNLPSYLHGNIPTAYKDLNMNKIYFGILAKSFFKKKIYKVQNYLSSDYSDILISNPCSSQIIFTLNNKKYSLDKGCCKIITIEEKEVILSSNAYLLRPIIIEYKRQYIDVYHG